MQEINAQPTKKFFVEILTRDIPLDRSILDLIDNSIDGAKRLRKNEDYSGLYINISINKDRFIIEDNCGGISEEAARTQAFVFGKPDNYKLTEHSIGRFGIGMKRSLFKIGKLFNIVSVHNKSSFSLDIDVNKWLKEDEWNFSFSNESIEEDNYTFDCRTIITVDNLNPDVEAEFSENYVIEDLRKAVALTHSLLIDKGLTIYINSKKVYRNKFFINFSENFMPQFIDFSYQESEGKAKVNVQIVAGVTERSLHDAGWTIFCNDRMIVYADKTKVSGWEKKSENEDKDPIGLFHHDFALFRGYVHFNSDDASQLPLTTTKTGIDVDMNIYKAALHEMKDALRKVIPFLRKRAQQERAFDNEEIDGKPLTDLVVEASKKEFFKFDVQNQNFYYYADEPNQLEIEDEPMGGTISYWKSEEEINLLKRHFKAKSYKEIGIKTFDYYYKIVKGMSND